MWLPAEEWKQWGPIPDHTSVLSHQTITLSLTLCFCTFRLQDAVGVSAISLPVCPRRADRVSPFLPSPPLCTRRVTTLNQPLSSAWAIGTALETSVFMTDVPHACVK